MRKITLIAAFAAVFALGLAAAPAFGPGSSISGGDDRTTADSAWFLGKDKVIRYCVERDAAFKVPAAEAIAAVERSFATWRDYIATRKTDAFGGEAWRLATTWKQVASCDGTDDIRFYFGGQPAEVEAHKTFFVNPAAFAARTAYDLDKGWSDGFIWVSGTKDYLLDSGAVVIDWTKPGSLDAILLHELGHVFGNGHVSGTIMEEAIIDRIAYAEPGDEFLRRIDDWMELATCEDCSESVPGYLGPSPKPSVIAATFEMISGRVPTGSITARLDIKREMDPTEGVLRPKMELTIGDAAGITKFPLVFSAAMYWTDTPGAWSFRRFARGDGGFAFTQSMTSRVQIIPATIETANGTKEVYFERNVMTPRSPISITWVHKQYNARLPLFRARTSGLDGSIRDFAVMEDEN